MTNIRALLIQPGGIGALIDLDPQLAGIEEAVGGSLEVIRSVPDGWRAYCDKQSKTPDLDDNAVATMLVKGFGWNVWCDILCGPVLFVGETADGAEADVPEIIINEWKRLALYVASITE